jgi:hypothetical protein
MDINPEDESFYTTHYQEAFLKYLGNQYCPQHRGVPDKKFETMAHSNLVALATASESY